MIKSFADKRTEQIFSGEKAKRLDARLQKKALRRLRYLDAAKRIEDLLVPPLTSSKRKRESCRDFMPYG